jgi:hypothetical protein
MGVCETCGKEEESMHLALLKCEPAFAFWRQFKDMCQTSIHVLHNSTQAEDHA